VGIGAAVALLGYGLLSLPPAVEGSALGLLVFGEGDAVSVRFGSAGGFRYEENIPSVSLPIRAEALLVGFDGLLPILGGSERIVLTSVRFGNGASSRRSPPTPIESFLTIDSNEEAFSAAVPGISLKQLTAEFVAERTTPGTRLGIYQGRGRISILP
jgi:hypothetical protein